MSDLYERIEALCARRRLTVTAMCKASGASRGSLTDLKMGRKQSLSAETLQKIAAVLDVTVDALLSPEKEKQSGEPRTVTNEELRFALWGDAAHMDDADLEDVMRYAAFVAQRKKEKK